MARDGIVSRWQAWAPYLRDILRITTAFVFVQAGTMKLWAFPIGMPPDNGVAHPFTQVWIGGVLEVVLGALVLVGLFTRAAAFLLAGMMAVAYFQFFAPLSFW